MVQFNKTLIQDNEVPREIIDSKIKRKIMSYNADLMLVKAAFLKGGIEAIHKHPLLQISYVIDGIFEIKIGEGIKTLKSGDIYFVPSNVLHGAVCLKKGMLIDVFNPMREDFVIAHKLPIRQI